MATRYYQRTIRTHTDGGPLFANDLDKRYEADIQALVEEKWNCQVLPFGQLCPVDYYAIRDGRIVGVLEIKARQHESGKYPTVFLNVRKWLALRLASLGMNCPAVFVVRFTDGIYYIPVDEIDTKQMTLGGTHGIVKSHTDREPVIHVPVASMKRLD